MRILLITAHPNPRSFNFMIAHRLQERLEGGGMKVVRLDLYPERFDPVLPLEEMLRKASFDSSVLDSVQKLKTCQGILFVHPDWWGLPPAILKGWVDRVLLPGVGYAFEEESVPVPLLGHLRGGVVVTRDNPGRGLSEAFWMQEVFPLCGIEPACFQILDGLKSLSSPEREKKLIFLIEEMYTFFVG
ncbi:MAG: NAD(P)H-dependent oxidoreductase [Spirochaetales bacterium]